MINVTININDYKPTAGKKDVSNSITLRAIVKCCMKIGKKSKKTLAINLHGWLKIDIFPSRCMTFLN